MFIELMIENLNLGDINPLNCGHEKCASAHSWGPATREFHLIHYVHEGQGILYNDRGSHPVKSGQFFVIHPGEVTTYDADPIDPWDYTWIGFETSPALAAYFANDVYDVPGCESIFQQMINSNLQSGREFFLCAKIYELLGKLQRQNLADEASHSRYVRIAKNFIETNFHKDIRIAQVAENLRLDRSYFTHLFTDHMNLSPQQYLIQVRMQHAQILLEQSDYSVSHVAAQVGYPDSANFSRIFRRYVGVSPSSFRKKQLD